MDGRFTWWWDHLGLSAPARAPRSFLLMLGGRQVMVTPQGCDHCKSAESQLKWLTASRGGNCCMLWTSMCLFSVKQFLKVLQGCLSHHIFLKPISNPETKNSYSYTISSAYCLIILNIGCSIPIFAMLTMDKIEKIKHTSMYVCLPLWEIVYSLKTAFCWVSPSCVARRPMRTAHIHVRIHKINQAQMI